MPSQTVAGSWYGTIEAPAATAPAPSKAKTSRVKNDQRRVKYSAKMQEVGHMSVLNQETRPTSLVQMGLNEARLQTTKRVQSQSQTLQRSQQKSQDTRIMKDNVVHETLKGTGSMPKPHLGSTAVLEEEEDWDDDITLPPRPLPPGAYKANDEDEWKGLASQDPRLGGPSASIKTPVASTGPLVSSIELGAPLVPNVSNVDDCQTPYSGRGRCHISKRCQQH